MLHFNIADTDFVIELLCRAGSYYYVGGLCFFLYTLARFFK